MLKPFSFSWWLAGRRGSAPIVKNPSATRRHSASLILETLEDRLTPGSLLGSDTSNLLLLAPQADSSSATRMIPGKPVTPSHPTNPKPPHPKPPSHPSHPSPPPTHHPSNGGSNRPTNNHPSNPSSPGGGSRPGNGGGSSGSSTLSVVRVTDLRDATNNTVVNKVTNDNEPLVVGIGPADASISVYAKGKFIGKTTVDSGGNWSMQPANTLANGIELVSAVLTGKSDRGAMFLQTTIWKAPPKITITVPEYADAQTPPTISVSVSNAPYGYDPNIHIDVQFAGDNEFTNDYVVTTDTSVTLWSLTRGTDVIRVRVTDNLGNKGVATQAMLVNPYAGYVGSQDLLKLATGWDNSPYNAPNSVPGAWGQGGLNGGGGGGMSAPGGSGSSSTAAKLFFIDSQNRVMVDVRATLAKHYAEFQAELQNLGMSIITLDTKDYMVVGYLPINEITALNNTQYFSAITPEYRPEPRAGAGAQQGDPVIGGPDFRTSTGADGSGIHVGVISDSVNEYMGGIADSIAAGALPKSGVTILEDDPNGPATDEGRAMLEIVHRVAPGAVLGFHTGDNSIIDMATGISQLQSEFGANVITDDIGYFDEPMFSVGRLGQAVDYVVSQKGVVYTTAAGNAGNMGFRAPWDGVAATVGNVTGTFMNFGLGQPLQPFTLAPGDQIDVTFCWDAAYLEGGSALPQFQVPNNVVAYIVDAVTGSIVGTFNAQGQNTNEAYQDINYTNGTMDSRFYFAFQLQSGPAPQEIGWILQTINSVQTPPATDIHAKGEGASTLQGHTLALGAMTTAAVPYNNPTKAESFSALGGQVQIFSDDNGTRFSSPTFVAKPDVAAPDGVQTSFFDPNMNDTFFGTSAAAPHVAAAAALLESQNRLVAASAPIFNPNTQTEPLNPIVDNIEIDNYLRATTTTRIVPGFDDSLGHGVIHLQELNYFPGIYEINDSSDAANNLGAVGGNKVVMTAEIGDSYFNLPDQDWYAVTPTSTGALNVVIDNPNLEVHVFAFSTDPTGLVPGGFTTEVPSGTTFAAGSLVFVEVKGISTTAVTSTTGVYDLSMEVDPPGVTQPGFQAGTLPIP
jgi:hypothetical protein